MAEDDKIRYRDIIEPDDSIERLIKQLSDLNKSYETMVNAIRAGADRIVHSLKTASGATKDSRKNIDEAAASADRLERAYNELKFAMSDTGKTVAWLKAQTLDQNKATVQQQRYLKQAADSYNRLKSDLNQAISLYKSLTAAEREDSQMGQQLVQDILNLKNQIQALDNQLKPHVQQITEVQKAEQRLAFLQSEEGKRLLDLKAKIAELTAARRGHKQSVDSVTAAQQKLAAAQSAENQQLKLYNMEIAKANTIAKLQAQLASSTAGSYNYLSAQYSLNRIRLNEMTKEQIETTDAGKLLVEQTRAIRAQMVYLQESTGNYTLSVGNYAKSWDRLGFSVVQVIRELPSAAVSLNTLMLAISNNLPMVGDEIKRVREENKLLIAQGRPTVSVTKTIISSIFSWQTALVGLLTILSMYGDAIAEWIVNLFKGNNAAKQSIEVINNIAKELENTNDSYGNHIVTLKKLQDEWKGLKTVAEQNQWIKDNANEFRQLGFAVNDVTDAENIFVNQTDAVILAMQLRAKAAAANKLAEEQYEKALVARNKEEARVATTLAEGTGHDAEEIQNLFTQREVLRQQYEITPTEETQKQLDEVLAKIEQIRQEYMAVGPNSGAIALGSLMAGPFVGPSSFAPMPTGNPVEQSYKNAQELHKEAIQLNTEEEESAIALGDSYYRYMQMYTNAADALLGTANIDIDTSKNGSRRGRRPIDLTDTINRNDITIQRKYEESVTKLVKDEYAQRKKEARDWQQDEENKLHRLYKKNIEYVNNVDGKYKELTESQKEQIKRQQDWILKTIANNARIVNLQLKQIMNEQRIATERNMRNTINPVNTGGSDYAVENSESTVTTNMVINRDTSGLEASLVRERELKSENLDLEYALILDTNRKLIEAGDEEARSEEEIQAELSRKKLELWAEYDKMILEARRNTIDAELALVKKGSEDELNLLLKRNSINRQLALVENAAAPAEQQQSTSVINQQFNKSDNTIRGDFAMSAFDQQQAADEAVFNEVERSQREITNFVLLQERERWNKQIELAKQGAIEWTDAQMAEAQSKVTGIDNQLQSRGVGKDTKSTDENIKGGFMGFLGDVGDMGLQGALLDRLGFSAEGIAAMDNATQQIIGNIQEIMDAEVEAAEQAVELAQERVDAAQSAYDAEVEARNNGYANNVATAKKELEQEKKNQAQKQKELEKAQKKQAAVDTLMQTSSLITATAQIFSSMSGVPIVGWALAIAAVAAMWTTFAAAKIKAAQVTKSAQYGEGGLEFLEGGSHASGNDIDLQTTNKNGKNMRAEGGEALAIINKRSTSKYRKELPDIVNSLNKGTFEDRYLKAFTKIGNTEIMAISPVTNNIDLSAIEREIISIRKQNEQKYYALPNGSIIVKYKNVKRLIKN